MPEGRQLTAVQQGEILLAHAANETLALTVHNTGFLLDRLGADFRVFADMIQHWAERYAKEHGETAGLRDVVKDSVHDWYEQALVETVIGVQALKGSREWSTKQIESALSEEALTSVVMQRYHPYNSVKRELGTKIAPLKK